MGAGKKEQREAGIERINQVEYAKHLLGRGEQADLSGGIAAMILGDLE